MFFFLALIGKVSWTEFAACSCANFAGAFLGAVLVAIFYLPHFGYSLPLPSDTSDAARILCGPVSLEKDAGRYASAFGPASRQVETKTIRDELRHLLPSEDHFSVLSTNKLEDSKRQALLEKMKVNHTRRLKATHQAEATRLQFMSSSVKSVQVAALLHGHDIALLDSIQEDNTKRHSVQVAPLLHTHDEGVEKTYSGPVSSQTIATGEAGEEVTMAETVSKENDVEAHNNISSSINNSTTLEETYKSEAASAAYKAALQADASAKLSIFCTRPAIFNRPYNFLQEALLTAALVMGAELFNLRREWQTELTGVPLPDGPFFQSFYVAMYIAMLILGLGGVTGLAANPARDLGPRLAHQLLPLPGKGSSEWHYGLVVPLFGTLTGSLLGAAVFKGCEALYEMVEIVEEETGAGVEL